MKEQKNIPQNLRFVYNDMQLLPSFGSLSRMHNKPVGIYDFDKKDWYLKPTDSIKKISKSVAQITGRKSSDIENEMKENRDFDNANKHIFESVPFKD